jgi:hypothetical protein
MLLGLAEFSTVKVPPKRLLTFNGPHGVAIHKMYPSGKVNDYKNDNDGNRVWRFKSNSREMLYARFALVTEYYLEHSSTRNYHQRKCDK